MISTLDNNKQALIAECSSRAPRVKGLPFYYHVHLNMPCNQKCIMCVPDGNHPRDLLSYEGFLRFFEQIKPYAQQLTLIGGEPLMYPWIREVLDVLAEHEIAVTINTNATLLNERITPRLLSLHELYLRCSIDASTAATYLKIRGTDVFEKVTSQMKRFADLSRDMPHIKMIIEYVVMKENLHEVVPFVDFAKTLNPHRLQFNPVRHVIEWHVTNDTGWVFDGTEQSVEFFKDEYNEVMSLAAAKCEREGVNCAVQLL
jgi:MoaA/NifB/PqqE/SkfB family radical SAM enzyme